MIQNGLGYGTVYEVSDSGQERVIYTFQGGNDGVATQVGVIADGAGNLYGATIYGGGRRRVPPAVERSTNFNRAGRAISCTRTKADKMASFRWARC